MRIRRRGASWENYVQADALRSALQSQGFRLPAAVANRVAMRLNSAVGDWYREARFTIGLGFTSDATIVRAGPIPERGVTVAELRSSLADLGARFREQAQLTAMLPQGLVTVDENAMELKAALMDGLGCLLPLDQNDLDVLGYLDRFAAQCNLLAQATDIAAAQLSSYQKGRRDRTWTSDFAEAVAIVARTNGIEAPETRGRSENATKYHAIASLLEQFLPKPMMWPSKQARQKDLQRARAKA